MACVTRVSNSASVITLASIDRLNSPVNVNGKAPWWALACLYVVGTCSSLPRNLTLECEEETRDEGSESVLAPMVAMPTPAIRVFEHLGRDIPPSLAIEGVYLHP